MIDRILFLTFSIILVSQKVNAILNFEYSEFNESDLIFPTQRAYYNNGYPVRKTFSQYLDHFDVRNQRMFKMHYYEERKYFSGYGPILIILGGEVGISPAYLQTGLIKELAELNHGMIFYVEHRYYGSSKPFQNITVDNLKYLTIEQVLADYAFFIDYLKNSGYVNAYCPVIVYGMSYAGNLAAWMRLKYPHLVKGAVASSAPINIKLRYPEYMDPVVKAVTKNGPGCLQNVRLALVEIKTHYRNPKVRKYIKDLFNFCDLPDVKNAREASSLTSGARNKLIYAAMFNRVDRNNRSDLEKKCSIMTNEWKYNSPLERLSKWTRRGACQYYRKYMEGKASLGDPSMVYTYQQCTQIGQFQRNVLFSDDRDNWTPAVCAAYFGRDFNSLQMERGIRDMNWSYGGKNSELSNVIFVNGEMDPWHLLSVLHDLNGSVRAIYVRNSAHVGEVFYTQNDNAELLQAVEEIKRIVRGWSSNLREREEEEDKEEKKKKERKNFKGKIE